MRMTDTNIDRYILKGGDKGRERMSVISRVLEPSTHSLLDRLESCLGRMVLDVGCGSGDVALELARRIGTAGHVVGIDLDETQLTFAREDAAKRNIVNVEFQKFDVLDAWPWKDIDMVYIRFILNHLENPLSLIRKSYDALRPGGCIVVEDIDYGGQFCDPSSSAVDRYCEMYVQTALHQRGNPFIGRSLFRLLEEAGYANVESNLVQPYGRVDDIKQVVLSTLEDISDRIISFGIATPDELRQVLSDLQTFFEQENSTVSFPRIFQLWGYKRKTVEASRV